MVSVNREEIAAAVILPHFDAVRDTFASFSPESGFRMERANEVRLLVDRDIRNSPRHYAATTEDGLRMMLAPEIIDLDEESFVAILAHEFGHAVDFLYPSRWITPPDGPGKAAWIERPESHEAKKWQRLWRSRSRDQIEWAADGIAYAVTGRKIVYGGDCILQRFRRGFERPAGLR